MDEEIDSSAVVEHLKAAGSEISKQVPPLLKLGECYLIKAKKTANGSDFAKAIGLFNAALVRSRLVENRINENEILRGIVETYREFLLAFAKDQGISKDIKDEIKNEVNSHKEWIANERRIFKERVDKIDSSFSRNESEDLYKIHAEKMQEVFQDIQDMYMRLVSMLVKECERKIGQPPCNYVIIALGSVARMEATPFSDLEFAILYSDPNIGENINYFQVLTHFLHLKVINLGETILPALAIKELNDFQSLDPSSNWFYDSKTPRGISFDGAMPWASKTPLGRMPTKNKPALELIRTPEQMACLQDEDIAVKEGYHLADIMSRTSFLYGDPALLDEYNERVGEKLNIKKSSEGKTARTIGFIRGIHQMMVDIKTFHPNDSYLGAHCAAGGIFDAKRQFYRLISLLLSDLGLILNIRSSSPWQLISELLSQEIIDKSECANIKVCLSIANEMRLKTYFGNNGQKEVFSPFPEYLSDATPSTDDPIFGDFDEDVVVRLLSTSNDVCKRCLDFALKYFEQDEVDTSILQKPFFSSSKPYLMSTLYVRLQNFPKALEWMELESKDCLNYSISLNDKGLIYNEFGEYEKSVECFENALEEHYKNEGNSSLDVLSCKNNIASMLIQMGKYEEARIKLEEAIEKHSEMYCEGSQKLNVHRLVLNLGRTYHECGDMKSAIEAYQKAEEMQSKLTGVPDMRVIHLNLYFAMSLSEFGEHVKSMEYIKKALQLGHKVFGEHNLSIRLAEIYVFAGIVYERCHLEDEALSFLKRSLKLLQLLMGDKPHPGKVSSLNKLGNFFYRKDQTSEAIKSFSDALKQARIVYHGMQRVTVANTLNNLGMALKHNGRFQESLANFQEAKEIMDSILGPGHTHPITASIFNNLVTCYQQFGDLKQAKKYCVQSVNINRKIRKTIDACPTIVFRLFTLSQICEALGEKDEALKHLEEAREIYAAAGSKHPIVVTILNKLCMKYFMMGLLDKSKKAFEETVQISNSFSNDDSCPDNVKETLEMLKLAK